MFFQYADQLTEQLFKRFVTVAGMLWHKSKSVWREGRHYRSNSFFPFYLLLHTCVGGG